MKKFIMLLSSLIMFILCNCDFMATSLPEEVVNNKDTVQEKNITDASTDMHLLSAKQATFHTAAFYDDMLTYREAFTVLDEELFYTDIVDPYKIKDLLKYFDVLSYVTILQNYVDAEKLAFINDEVQEKHCTILLTRLNGSVVYVTVVSRFLDSYYVNIVYDSDFLSSDNNGEEPGNNTLTGAELLDLWATGTFCNYSFIALNTCPF